MPKIKGTGTETDTSDDGNFNVKGNDAAAIVEYLIPAVHMLENIDVVSTKMVASVVFELCKAYRLPQPRWVIDMLLDRPST